MDTEENTGLRPMALVDMGSSSVRLVVYADHGCAANVVFNEKHVCDLAEGLESSGMLSAVAIERTRQVIQRFVNIARYRGIPQEDMHVLATSAVRDAVNGMEFVAGLQEIVSVPVHILSGKDEARYGALGVLHHHVEACGVVGDQGGGSLELAEIDSAAETSVGRCASLAFGAVRSQDLLRRNPAELCARLGAELEELSWLAEHAGGRFYAVGGSWRNLGMLYQRLTGYPLAIIAGYRVKSSELSDFLDRLQEMSPNEIADYKGVSKRRAAMMPFAAMMLEEILRYGSFSEVEFSGAGVREGAFYARLPPSEQRIDPLLRACSRYLSPLYQRGDAEALYRFGEPILRLLPRVSPRLRKALSLLINIAQSDYPEFRLEHALARVLHLAAPMLSHHDRAWLAVAVASGYGRIIESLPGARIARALLSERDFTDAMTAGATLRLGHRLSGGATGLLGQCSLEWHKNRLKLHVPEALRLDSETIKRLSDQLENRLVRVLPKQ